MKQDYKLCKEAARRFSLLLQTTSHNAITYSSPCICK